MTMSSHAHNRKVLSFTPRIRGHAHNRKVLSDGSRLQAGFDAARGVLRPEQYPHQATHPLPRVDRVDEAAA